MCYSLGTFAASEPCRGVTSPAYYPSHMTESHEKSHLTQKLKLRVVLARLIPRSGAPKGLILVTRRMLRQAAAVVVPLGLLVEVAAVLVEVAAAGPLAWTAGAGAV